MSDADIIISYCKRFYTIIIFIFATTSSGKSLVTWATYKTDPISSVDYFDGRTEWTAAVTEKLEVEEASEVTIPCRATQPDVSVSYSHRTFADGFEEEFHHVPIVLKDQQSNSTDKNLHREIRHLKVYYYYIIL